MHEARGKYQKVNLLLRSDTQNFEQIFWHCILPSMLSVCKKMIVLQLYITQRQTQKNTWLT